MRDIHMAYDEEGDILYISFVSNRQASTLSLNDNIVLRYDPHAGEAVGMTVIGFSDLLALEREGKWLPLRDLTELPDDLGKLVWNIITRPPVTLYLQVGGDARLMTRLAREFSLADLLLTV
jgi:uncharacterized protein YuzE